MIKSISLEITSTPFSILSSEIKEIMECYTDYSYIETERDEYPNRLDIEEELEMFHSRFNLFHFDPQSTIEDKELGLIEYVWRNNSEWIKFTFYLEDIVLLYNGLYV